jgi:hypothetical protein
MAIIIVASFQMLFELAVTKLPKASHGRSNTYNQSLSWKLKAELRGKWEDNIKMYLT